MASDPAHEQQEPSAHHDHSAHAHAPGHSHGHSHTPVDFGRAFAIGIALNLAFVAIEAGYGLISHSLALLADAGHNLSDVAGLAIAWTAATLGKRRPSGRFTYGLRSSSILAALANAVLLLIAVGAIAIEALQRFGTAQPVAGTTVMVVAAIGVVVNTATALLFAKGRKGDLNIRGAYLHMAGDAGVSLAVVVAGLAINLTGLNWIDPVTSLLVVVVIVWSTWGLLRDSVLMSLNAVPPGIDRQSVHDHLHNLPGVTQVHDLHIWSMSTTDVVLTAHLVRPDAVAEDSFLHDTAAALQRRFGIGHCTLQIECGQGTCALAPDEVV